MLTASHFDGKHMRTDGDKPKLVSVVALERHDESALVALASGLASGLDIRLAAAIIESARERDVQILPVDRFGETTCSGVAASVAGHAVVLGNAALFAALGLSVESLGNWPERLRAHGQSVFFVAVDGRTAGFFGVNAT